jgi:hypothetical protein
MDFEYLDDIFRKPEAAKKTTAPIVKTTNNSLEDIGFNLAAKKAATPAAATTPEYVDDIFKRDKNTGNYKYDLPAIVKPAQLVIKPEPETPATPATTSMASTVAATVKTAPIDTILFDDNSISIDRMFNLILEDIGGQELINIARNDIINGQQVSYQPIKNLSSIQQQYNYNNILGIQNTSDKYFSNFSIKFENKIPNYINDPNKSNVYLDNQTGDLVIETVNMETDEQIEVEITVSATIYEAEFGEIIS